MFNKIKKIFKRSNNSVSTDKDNNNVDKESFNVSIVDISNYVLFKAINEYKQVKSFKNFLLFFFKLEVDFVKEYNKPFISKLADFEMKPVYPEIYELKRDNVRFEYIRDLDPIYMLLETEEEIKKGVKVYDELLKNNMPYKNYKFLKDFVEKNLEDLSLDKEGNIRKIQDDWNYYYNNFLNPLRISSERVLTFEDFKKFRPKPTELNIDIVEFAYLLINYNSKVESYFNIKELIENIYINYRDIIRNENIILFKGRNKLEVREFGYFNEKLMLHFNDYITNKDKIIVENYKKDIGKDILYKYSFIEKYLYKKNEDIYSKNSIWYKSKESVYYKEIDYYKIIKDFNLR